MDPFQETQVIYGETVRVLRTDGPWALIEAIEQPEFTHNQKWEGYPGWIAQGALVPKPGDWTPNAVVSVLYAKLHDEPSDRSSFVEAPLGARLQVVSEKSPWARVRRPGKEDGWVRTKDLRRFSDMPKGEGALRRAVLKTARLFQEEPYYWGGRVSHRPDMVERPTGVDCSALVNLAYRVNGVDVPRDSHEQYLRSRPIIRSELKPGDLVFLAKTASPNRIVHVMLWAGNDRVVEAVHEYNVVRVVTVSEKLGKPLVDIFPLEAVGDRFVYFGRLVPDEDGAGFSWTDSEIPPLDPQ
jgi:gamma-D-glutamyl-L-lysine dipeptidyl-peptidase